MTNQINIPKEGRDISEIFSEMDAIKENDFKWEKGRVFCLTYPIDENHHDFLKEAYGKFISENFLNPMAFQSLKKMEREDYELFAKETAKIENELARADTINFLTVIFQRDNKRFNKDRFIEFIIK